MGLSTVVDEQSKVSLPTPYPFNGVSGWAGGRATLPY